MSRYSMIKLGVAAAGILVWGYGARIDDAHVRLAGMILLGVAVVLRFVHRVRTP